MDTTDNIDKKSLSVIVSVFNEELVLYSFWDEIKSIILEQLRDFYVQVIFVNDGSKDKSQEVVNRIINESLGTEVYSVASIEFSRNFGHEAAMIAGIDYSDADIIVCMDADLQHPPKLLPQMVEQYTAGYDIVLMNRSKREDKSFVSNIFSRFFYYIIDRLSETKFEKNASDFFLISKKVASILKTEYRERNRFLRGYIQNVGFKQCTLDFIAPARQAGESHYSFKSLIKLSFNAIFAFSNKPLVLSLIFSFIFLLFSLGIFIYSAIVYFWGNTPPSGYTTLILFQSIGFAVLCFLIAILSIYLGKTLLEIRDRPIYLIKNTNQSTNIK